MEETEFSVRPEKILAPSTEYQLNSTLSDIKEVVMSNVAANIPLKFQDNQTEVPNVDGSPTFSFVTLTGKKQQYIIIYSLLILISILLTSARSMMFYKVSMSASKGLHKKMFSCILKAPMRFFDTNASGKNIFISNTLFARER